MVQQAFISSDYDNDAGLKDILVGQSKNPDSLFAVHDWSVKVASSTWREEARRRIRASGQVIALCGQSTYLGTGVGIELGITQGSGCRTSCSRGTRTAPPARRRHDQQTSSMS